MIKSKMISSYSLPHDSAHLHVTGRSEYVDDRPEIRREVHVEVVFSTESSARILGIEFEEALKVPGVLRVFTGEDFHENLWGTIFKDQPLLATDEVRFCGEAIALVVGETRSAAQMGKDRIKVKFEPLDPILSIDEAKAKKSFFTEPRFIKRGNADEALAQSPHLIEGQIIIRGADHFYLESQCSIVYPNEDGSLEVHSSSQHPTETQHVVAHALGLPLNQVVCIVKRMGGGFGGKESQAAPFAAYAALVAQKLNRPARLVLTKDDDMIMTGKRNPFQNKYRVGFDHEGRILALHAELFSDGGAYADLSTSIMERAMLHIDNAYFIPHLIVTGQVCRTNFHPHTAFRGFGGPKGVATIEKIIEEIAFKLNKDSLDIRKLNLYDEANGRDITHYGQKVENNLLSNIFSELEKTSEYQKRRVEIETENQRAVKDEHVTHFRGLSLVPVKFGISFTTRFLNQANALVIIHRDGSVQVSTGATEMGQGVYARIAEIVAAELGLSRQEIKIMPTRTDKNGNTSPTAASSGTDLNGGAALIATKKIKYRLSQVAKKLLELPEKRWAKNVAGLGTEDELVVSNGVFSEEDSNLGENQDTGLTTYFGMVFANGQVFDRERPDKRISFSDVVNESYLNRISLSDYGFYRFGGGLNFNKLSGQGKAFLYFTQGAAAVEVSLHRDTGEVKVQRVDILMDLGRPVHRDLDIGQVTGGFVQGMGWVTTEKLFYSNKGFLVSHSPSTYKIPSVQDTPRLFNVDLVNNSKNVQNVKRTKAVGEPPLLLSIGVWTAILDALKVSRRFQNRAFPELEIPATQEQNLRQLYPSLFETWNES